MARDKVLDELRFIGRDELVKMCGEFDPPIKLPRTFSNLQAARMIRKRQLAAEAAAPIIQPEPEKPDNAEFLEATALVGSDKVDGRGGVREGAGRPKGMTAEKAAVAHLPQLPNESIVAAFRMAFAAWEASVKVSGVALSEDEAKQIALPVTQLLEYYFPGQIPEIAWTWIMAAWSVGSITMVRIQLIKVARQAKPVEAQEVAGG